METTGGCFIKYMFPVELDLTGLDIDGIEGYGMFIDETGSIITFDKDDLHYNLGLTPPEPEITDTIVQTVILDVTQTTYGSYISDDSFVEKLTAAIGLDDSVKIEVVSSTDTAATLTVVYNINIYDISSENVDSIKELQDQTYKDAVAGTTELLLGGAIYDMCYDDCVGTYVIYEGEEARTMTGDAFGSFRRLNSKQEAKKDKKVYEKS